MAFGTKTIETTGRMLRVSADGRPEWKAGGITIDWATVTAVGSDTTLSDGAVVKAGDKHLRYGQVMCKITATGLYGPYKSDASDGRQTLTNGECFVLDRTVVKSQLHGDQIGAIQGGYVFSGRITDVSGAPTLAALLAAMPRLSPVRD